MGATRGETIPGTIRVLFEGGAVAGLSDGQLLDRFLDRRDGAASAEVAFAALVERHGPMVLRACRDHLGHEHDAQDAFQATFLILARNAGSIRRRDSAEGWLRGVARRVAACSRRAAAVRRARERQAAGGRPDFSTDPEPSELASAVGEELDGLPEKDRAPLVLCLLDGLTHEQAADRLGWPVGTVKTRVRRARDRLRVALARRGLAPSLAGTAAALQAREAPAMPASLARATARAALGTPSGNAAVASTVPALIELGSRSLMMVRFKVAALLVASLGGFAAGANGLARQGSGPPGQASPADARPVAGSPKPAEPKGPDRPEAGPIDRATLGLREAWARKLAGLDEADWRTSFGIGQELAALPGEEGFAILEANWGKIGSVEARQQLLKAWYYAMPYPLRPRKHPRLVDGLDLGMRDRSPEVQARAMNYMANLAFRDFSEDFRAYLAWHQANRGQPLSEVIARSARQFAAEAARSQGKDALKKASWLSDHVGILRDMPEARQEALDAGLFPTLERWANGAEAGPSRGQNQLAVDALRVIGQLKPGEADLRRVVVPLLAKGRPAEVRDAAISALEGRENAWAIDLLLDGLKGSLEDGGAIRATVWASAGTLASFDDPKVIPTMIAVIDADNTYDTVYGVGYFGLGKLTGVKYDESHDGAWWRGWWEKNKARYPEAVRALEIPKLPRRRIVADREPADPHADVPSQDLRAGGDDMKRYFLIGAGQAKAPDEGYKLLIVLPGGDGSADFNPFIRRIRKNALNDRWLIAQAVAPKWDEDQFNRVVWPTATSKYPAARFTTEEFIRAIVADVKTGAKIDPRRVVLLGWSSGGPPCYAEALTEGSGVTGAFIAMSAFRPGQLPPLENAGDKAFYLLQSPQDEVTAIQHAEAAEKALQAAGAKVRLRRYEGGHGWLGDVWTMIGDGIAWLDQDPGKE